MDEDFELLSLLGPAGKGQENNPEDIEALDRALRKIGIYAPPPEYADAPQRYATEPMIGSLEHFQEQNGLKIDGYANPGGPTERAINNRLLDKPRGAALLYHPPVPISGTVGNGFQNERSDVASVQRRLGALGYLPEDPFDQPHGFIDEPTTSGIREFQRMRGLTPDGRLAPGGETEQALDDAVLDLARAQGRDWFSFFDRAARAQRGLETKLGAGRDDSPSPGDTEGEDDIVLTKGPPGGIGPAPAPPGSPPRARRGFEPRGLLEIDPRFAPPRRPNLRWSEPLPRDLEWANPGQRPSAPARPRIPLGPPTHDGEPPTIDDLPRALGLPPEPSIQEEARRALTIPQRPTPEPKIYIPQPGSPLRIPILDIHRGGMKGDPRTIQTTRDTTDAIKKACEDVFGEGVTFQRKMERYYPEVEKGTRKGSSFADEWAGMAVKATQNFTIDFVSDSYTPKVDGSPIAAEDRRYLKLEYNRSDEQHVVTVRVPKVWTFGQTLDKEKLYTAAKEICEQIKKMIGKGEIGPDKGRLEIKRTLKELVEPRIKKRPTPEPKDPPELER